MRSAEFYCKNQTTTASRSSEFRGRLVFLLCAPLNPGYSKPYNSVPQLLFRLHRHGLIIRDTESAADALRRLGHYRFTGYAHPFRDTATRDFFPGTTFGSILEIAAFDSELRKLALHAMEQVEIAVRFYIGHLIGRRSAYYLRDEDRAAREDFVAHFRTKYRSRVPVWAATEIMSWGRITKLYDLMHSNDRRLIAARFGYRTQSGEGNEGAFSSTLEFLRYTRNVCAHHSRFYNRPLDRTLVIPRGDDAPALEHLSTRQTLNRAYDALAILRYFLAGPLSSPEADRWTDNLRRHLKTLPTAVDATRTLGAPANWEEQPLWKDAPTDSSSGSFRIDILLDSQCIDKRTVLGLLTAKSTERENKKWLRYLVQQRAVIEVKVGETSYYPSFQFANGNVNTHVADINEKLLGAIAGAPAIQEEPAMTALRWWLRPSTLDLNKSRMDAIDLLPFRPHAHLQLEV